MFEKEAEEWVENNLHSTEEDYIKAFQDGAEFGYNMNKEDFRICEQNADTYYDKLQEAKRIIQEFLDLNYSEFTKTNAVFLHADKFLKESK